MLIDLLPEMAGQRVLCNSLGLAQFAIAAAHRWPAARVCCHYLDLYHAAQARGALAVQPANLSIACDTDFPSAEVDLVALPLSAHGEAELARDWLQAGHHVLRLGGQMWTSTDNRNDHWLDEQMRKLFGAVSRRPTASGVVYVARKTQPLK